MKSSFSVYRTKIRMKWYSFCMAFLYACTALSMTAHATSLSVPFSVETVSVSPNNGYIHTQAQFKGSKDTVIIIQDAHAQYTAQKNIQQILEQVTKTHDVARVFVEGSHGDMDVSLYRAFPLFSVRDRVLDACMKEGRVTGGEFFAITNPRGTSLYGVDNEDQYLSHCQTYANIMQVQDAIRCDSALITEKRDVYMHQALSKRMQDLYTAQSRYAENPDDFLSYYQFLCNEARSNNIGLDVFPHLKAAYESKQFSDSKVLARLQKETTNLIAACVSHAEATPSLVERLAYHELELKSGRMSPYIFYRHLSNVAEQLVIDMRQYDVVRRYCGYLQRIERSEGKSVERERIKLERLIEKRIVTSKEEEKALRTLRALSSYQAMMTLTATPDQYQFMMKEKNALEEWLKNHDMERQYYKDILRFYEEATRREEAMVRSVMDKPEHISILVVGGFHTPGITARLTEKRISYAVITPRVVAEEEGNALYTKIMKEQSAFFGVREGSRGGTLQILSGIARYNNLSGDTDTFLRDRVLPLFVDALKDHPRKNELIAAWNRRVTSDIIVNDADQGLLFLKSQKLLDALKKQKEADVGTIILDLLSTHLLHDTPPIERKPKKKPSQNTPKLIGDAAFMNILVPVIQELGNLVPGTVDEYRRVAEHPSLSIAERTLRDFVTQYRPEIIRRVGIEKYIEALRPLRRVSPTTIGEKPFMKEVVSAIGMQRPFPTNQEIAGKIGSTKEIVQSFIAANRPKLINHILCNSATFDLYVKALWEQDTTEGKLDAVRTYVEGNCTMHENGKIIMPSQRALESFFLANTETIKPYYDTIEKELSLELVTSPDVLGKEAFIDKIVAYIIAQNAPFPLSPAIARGIHATYDTVKNHMRTHRREIIEKVLQEAPTEEMRLYALWEKMYGHAKKGNYYYIEEKSVDPQFALILPTMRPLIRSNVSVMGGDAVLRQRIVDTLVKNKGPFLRDEDIARELSMSVDTVREYMQAHKEVIAHCVMECAETYEAYLYALWEWNHVEAIKAYFRYVPKKISHGKIVPPSLSKTARFYRVTNKTLAAAYKHAFDEERALLRSGMKYGIREEFFEYVIALIIERGVFPTREEVAETMGIFLNTAAVFLRENREALCKAVIERTSNYELYLSMLWELDHKKAVRTYMQHKWIKEAPRTYCSMREIETFFKTDNTTIRDVYYKTVAELPRNVEKTIYTTVSSIGFTEDELAYVLHMTIDDLNEYFEHVVARPNGYDGKILKYLMEHDPARETDGLMKCIHIYIAQNLEMRIRSLITNSIIANKQWPTFEEITYRTRYYVPLVKQVWDTYSPQIATEMIERYSEDEDIYIQALWRIDTKKALEKYFLAKRTLSDSGEITLPSVKETARFFSIPEEQIKEEYTCISADLPPPSRAELEKKKALSPLVIPSKEFLDLLCDALKRFPRSYEQLATMMHSRVLTIRVFLNDNEEEVLKYAGAHYRQFISSISKTRPAAGRLLQQTIRKIPSELELWGERHAMPAGVIGRRGTLYIHDGYPSLLYVEMQGHDPVVKIRFILNTELKIVSYGIAVGEKEEALINRDKLAGYEIKTEEFPIEKTVRAEIETAPSLKECLIKKIRLLAVYKDGGYYIPTIEELHRELKKTWKTLTYEELHAMMNPPYVMRKGIKVNPFWEELGTYYEYSDQLKRACRWKAQDPFITIAEALPQVKELYLDVDVRSYLAKEFGRPVHEIYPLFDTYEYEGKEYEFGVLSYLEEKVKTARRERPNGNNYYSKFMGEIGFVYFISYLSLAYGISSSETLAKNIGCSETTVSKYSNWYADVIRTLKMNHEPQCLRGKRATVSLSGSISTLLVCALVGIGYMLFENDIVHTMLAHAGSYIMQQDWGSGVLCGVVAGNMDAAWKRVRDIVQGAQRAFRNIFLERDAWTKYCTSFPIYQTASLQHAMDMLLQCYASYSFDHLGYQEELDAIAEISLSLTPFEQMLFFEGALYTENWAIPDKPMLLNFYDRAGEGYAHTFINREGERIHGVSSSQWFDHEGTRTRTYNLFRHFEVVRLLFARLIETGAPFLFVEPVIYSGQYLENEDITMYVPYLNDDYEAYLRYVGGFMPVQWQEQAGDMMEMWQEGELLKRMYIGDSTRDDSGYLFFRGFSLVRDMVQEAREHEKRMKLYEQEKKLLMDTPDMRKRAMDMLRAVFEKQNPVMREELLKAFLRRAPFSDKDKQLLCGMLGGSFAPMKTQKEKGMSAILKRDKTVLLIESDILEIASHEEQAGIEGKSVFSEMGLWAYEAILVGVNPRALTVNKTNFSGYQKKWREEFARLTGEDKDKIVFYLISEDEESEEMQGLLRTVRQYETIVLFKTIAPTAFSRNLAWTLSRDKTRTVRIIQQPDFSTLDAYFAADFAEEMYQFMKQELTGNVVQKAA